ncbi:unnamed protein product [Nezara viridula]|uniref:Uncharacterized protein n=1 Tax=Nezara viridula TaxID=85310 RepID=A0A9P0H4V5_NEZVI|nr:unnamed protein product [Nezara viridula]
MLILYGLLFLSTSVISIPAENTTPQVSLTLYYETLCPFCQNFFSNELAPTFLDKDYGPLFKYLNLVPFGVAEVMNSTAHKIVCQHDEVECQGNRFHSCAIKHIKDKKALVNYISCLMDSVEVDSEEDEEYPVDKCLDKVPDGLFPKIMKCYNSEEGWKLLEEYGKMTKKFFNDGEEFVPYVSFNNEKNDDLAMEAIEDLKKIMSRLTGKQYSSSSEEEYD